MKFLKTIFYTKFKFWAFNSSRNKIFECVSDTILETMKHYQFINSGNPLKDHKYMNNAGEEAEVICDEQIKKEEEKEKEKEKKFIIKNNYINIKSNKK